MRAFATAIVLSVLALGTAQGQTGERSPLPLGESTTGTTSPDAPAAFSFTADSAGVLTAAVRTDTGSDLVLYVCDEPSVAC